jgi:L-ascorbate metabolism protein UlaG (beta-lactamase superfamily)
MEITWYGNSCFALKGRDSTVLTDPYTELGGSLPNLKVNLITLASSIDSGGKIIKAEGAKILDWPGEFEVAGIAVEAWEVNGVNVFSFVLDGFHVCHLSGIQDVLPDSVVEQIGDVDILLIPVGGANLVLSPKQASQVVDAIEPRIVIPMYFSSEASKLDLNGPEEFLKLVAKPELQAQASFVIKSRSELPEDKMDFVLLEAQA